MENIELQNYIAEQRGQGIEDIQIKQALLDAGWEELVIDEALFAEMQQETEGENKIGIGFLLQDLFAKLKNRYAKTSTESTSERSFLKLAIGLFFLFAVMAITIGFVYLEDNLFFRSSIVFFQGLLFAMCGILLIIKNRFALKISLILFSIIFLTWPLLFLIRIISSPNNILFSTIVSSSFPNYGFYFLNKYVFHFFYHLGFGLSIILSMHAFFVMLVLGTILILALAHEYRKTANTLWDSLPIPLYMAIVPSVFIFYILLLYFVL